MLVFFFFVSRLSLFATAQESPHARWSTRPTLAVDGAAEKARLALLAPEVQTCRMWNLAGDYFGRYVGKTLSRRSELAANYGKLTPIVKLLEHGVHQTCLKLEKYDKYNVTPCEHAKKELRRSAWSYLFASRGYVFARLYSALGDPWLEEWRFAAKNQVEAFLHSVYTMAAELLFNAGGTDGLSRVGLEVLCEVPAKHELAAHLRLNLVSPLLSRYYAAFHNHLLLGIVRPGFLDLVQPNSFKNIAGLTFHDQEKFMMSRFVRLAYLLWEIRHSRRDPATRLSMAEVGVFRGATSAFVLKNVPNIDYTCIDPFVAVENPSYFVSEPLMEEALRSTAGEERVKSRLSAVSRVCPEDGYETSNASCFRMLVNLSTQAASSIERNSMDLIFIDAEHTFDALVADVRSYLPKLRRKAGTKYREGGPIASVLAGHDCCEANSIVGFPGVRDALQNVFGEVLGSDEAPILHLGHDDTWWVYFA
eukprot:TRINITY_DN1677_c2_g1_i1.p1 TRINITY_DN1677_c2_g1~~TRINITY_DN1677_c2_g1_i1.p1  ORF type:complete len:477 (-),score=36.96 TRINITY_DN1677_c2_g1_i1:59-1489(-)